MDSLNVKNINDEKIFNVIDPNGQGEVVNRIRPISITITQKAETINNETVSNVSLSVYWNDTWKSILELSFDDSLRQEYGKLVTDLTAIQKDIDMKQYKDAETKTNDFLKYVSNLSSKYTNIPETKAVATSKNDFVSIIAERNNFKVNISDTLLNFMLKKFAKVDNLDYKKANECHSVNRTSCIENSIDMYFHSPELFKKQAYMTIVKDNKVVGSYKATYDEFCKLANKFDLTPQKFGYSKDRLAGYMKTADVVMQNIFFDSVDEAKEWQEMVDEKKKEKIDIPEEEETTETTETETKTTMEEGKSESPVKEDGGLARPSEDFASDEIPESEPRQQGQQQGGQMAASRRLNLLKKKALKKKAGTGNFKTYEDYPLIAIGDNDVYSIKDFVNNYNEENEDKITEEEVLKSSSLMEMYNDDLTLYYQDYINEMESAINRKDTPYHKIGIKGGYYEGLQLTVEEDSGSFFDDYDNEHDDEYSEYFESHNYAELPKEYEDARLNAWRKEIDRVAQIMRDLGKEQGWGEYAVAYRMSNGETGYSRVNASKKELKLKRKANLKKHAIEGDVQEQDMVPAKIETKVYLQSEKSEDFAWLLNGSGRIEILAPKDLILGATGSGDNSNGVNELRDYIKKDLEKISVEEMQKTVSEYGIENVKEMDRDELERYLVWLLAGDTADDLENRLADKEEIKSIKAKTTNKMKKSATDYKGEVAELLNEINEPDVLVDYISEDDAKKICKELNIPHEAEWYKGDLRGYIDEIPDGMVDVLIDYISESDAEHIWRQIQHDLGNDASKKTNVKKQAEETIEEKMEKQVGEDGDVKGVIGVGDIVCIKFYNLSEGDFAKYSEFLGMPMLLIENDKEDINKVIIEQVEYPFQRVTINKDNIGLFDNIKEEQVLVEDVDGDEMITDFVELPVVAKQCKIKSIHKAARLGGK